MSSARKLRIFPVLGATMTVTRPHYHGVQEDIMYSRANRMLQLFDGDDTQQNSFGWESALNAHCTALRREQHDFDSLIGQLSLSTDQHWSHYLSFETIMDI